MKKTVIKFAALCGLCFSLAYGAGIGAASLAMTMRPSIDMAPPVREYEGLDPDGNYYKVVLVGTEITRFKDADRIPVAYDGVTESYRYHKNGNVYVELVEPFRP